MTLSGNFFRDHLILLHMQTASQGVIGLV